MVTYNLAVEMAYLVHLDIRAVALLHSAKSEFTVEEVRVLAKAAAKYDDVLFQIVVFSGDRYFALYSKYQWAIDLYQWAARQPHDTEHAIRGLLHGIPARGIQEFLDRCNKKVAA